MLEFHLRCLSSAVRDGFIRTPVKLLPLLPDRQHLFSDDWRTRGRIIRTVHCCIVFVHKRQHIRIYQ